MRSCFFVPGKELKMADTLLRFKPEMAEKFGVNAAIVAQLIWEKITEEGGERHVHIKEFRVWFRCSQLLMSGYLGCMSKDQVRRAVRILVENSILKKDCLNKDRFDHTNWYSFTPYGEQLMKRETTKEEGEILC